MSLRFDDLDARPDSGYPQDPTQPMDMDPFDRLDEIAGILARGVVRLHGRVLPEQASTHEHSDWPPSGLELSALPRPDVLAG